MKEQTFPIVIPFFPILTNLTDPTLLTVIENENEIPAGSLRSLKWVKSPERRKPGQKVAHALLLVRDTQVANTLLSEGMYVHRTKLFPKKDRKEPVRCAKCQHWGHIARDCSSVLDVCSTCGGPHRASACDHPQRKYCVSCDASDHSSNSRTCAEFRKRCDALNAKHPDNLLPYFPTAERWTQADLPNDYTPEERTHELHSTAPCDGPPPPPSQSTSTTQTTSQPPRPPAAKHTRTRHPADRGPNLGARQTTLDNFARKPQTTTVVNTSTIYVPPHILDYSPPVDPLAFADPPQPPADTTTGSHSPSQARHTQSPPPAPPTAAEDPLPHSPHA